MRKTVLITGGNSGIGFATANLFAQNGYKVYITGRSEEKITKAASKISATPILADMINPDAPKEIAKHFASGLDVLVNNAGLARFANLNQITKTMFEELFSVNIISPIMLIKELSTALAKKQGSVVNVSSVITHKGIPTATVYAATKGALEAATRCLALELAPENIRVNAIAPGGVDTPIIQKLGLNQNQIIELQTKQEKNIPMNRYGKPEEIAHIIFALAEATYVTGSVWRADGGVTT